MESILKNPLEISESDIVSLLGVYSQDFNVPLLVAQLRILPTLCHSASVTEVVDILRSESCTVRAMLSQCVKLVTLILCIPASVASAERSFSALRRVKTYLRSTMGQPRLSHLPILHIHREMVRQLKRSDILREFVHQRPERRSVFGL
jgi:hypothetical protein